VESIAASYARWWAPIIRPAALEVLDLVAADIAERRTTILDIGTGTGSLGIAAVERWPGAQVTGIDASGAMLEGARDDAEVRLTLEARRRYHTEVAFADALPYADASFDAGVSSFVLQLVPNRLAALREARRVLRPGAPLGWVTWMRGGSKFAADAIADEVLDDAGFDPPESDGPNGDVASAASAAAAMRRAGFRAVTAREGLLEHAWDVEGYVGFFTEFDEASLFADLEPAEREEIVGRLRDRLGRLSADELTLRLPIVYVRGVVP
jgi:ubiquinone/menaquinone biosynthesis C-methylase UbiE